MRPGQTIFLLAGIGTWLLAAQPWLAPCVWSAASGAGLRLVFRPPAARSPKPARVTLVLHLKRPAAPAALRINGRPVQVVSGAKGWITALLPAGVSWERFTVEPGASFDGCSLPAFAPYLVLDAAPRGRR